MSDFKRSKGCPRCGGDLVLEPGTSLLERQITYVSCLLCGELRFLHTRPPAIDREKLRGRPGRPRKQPAVV